MITAGAFAVAIAWTGLSAGRHSTAVSKCQKDFFSDGGNDVSTLGERLCDIFPWVNVGLMGGLVVVLGILQVSFDIYARADR
jgi:hypothetical protein